MPLRYLVQTRSEQCISSVHEFQFQYLIQLANKKIYHLFSVVFEWLFSRLERGLFEEKRNAENKIINKSSFLPFLFFRLN